MATDRGALEVGHVGVESFFFVFFDIFGDFVLFDVEFFEDAFEIGAGLGEGSLETVGVTGESRRVDKASIVLVWAFAAAHLRNAKIEAFV